MATLYTYALTTLADVKESLGITNSAKDNLITRKINQATDIIEGYIGLDTDHHIKETTYTNEEFDASGIDQLLLRAWPVTAISDLGSRASSLNESSWTTIQSTDYFFDEFSGVIEGLSTFVGGYNRYRVTYTAGYSTIPADISEAAVMLASTLVQNADQTGSGVKAKTEGQRKVEYFESQADAGSLVEQLGLDDMLDRYKRYVV